MTRSVRILWRIFLYGFGLPVILLIAANFGLFGKMPSLQELEKPQGVLCQRNHQCRWFADG